MKKKSIKYCKLQYLMDYLFKMSLPKIIQEINTIKSTYLPLSGGIMTGNINWNKGVIRQNGDSFEFVGDKNLPNQTSFIACRSATHPSESGWFYFGARNTEGGYMGICKPNGTFTWGGKNVITSDGGTINGNLTLGNASSSYGLQRPDNSGELGLRGGVGNAGGAYLYLHGKDMGGAESDGRFDMGAVNSSNTYMLTGKPDGTLTWGGKHVVRIDAQSTGATGYRKYADGFRIQWGRLNVNECVKTTVTLPIAFSNTNYHVDVCNASGKTVGDTEGVMTVCEYATTNFKISTGYINPNTSPAVWFACGY